MIVFFFIAFPCKSLLVYYFLQFLIYNVFIFSYNYSQSLLFISVQSTLTFKKKWKKEDKGEDNDFFFKHLNQYKCFVYITT